LGEDFFGYLRPAAEFAVNSVLHHLDSLIGYLLFGYPQLSGTGQDIVFSKYEDNVLLIFL